MLRVNLVLLSVIVLFIVLESVSSYPVNSKKVSDDLPSSIVMRSNSRKGGHRKRQHQLQELDGDGVSRGLVRLARYPSSEADLKTEPAPPKKPKKKKNRNGKQRKNKRNRKHTGSDRKHQSTGNRLRQLRMARRVMDEDDDVMQFRRELMLGLGSNKPKPSTSSPRPVTPFVSVGVFGDMKKFFEDLKTNLDSSEVATASHNHATKSGLEDSGLDELEDLLLPQALSDASRNGNGESTLARLPPQQLRGFVSMGPEPPSMRRKAHHYDPGLLWTGLGRR